MKRVVIYMAFILIMLIGLMTPFTRSHKVVAQSSPPNSSSSANKGFVWKEKFEEAMFVPEAISFSDRKHGFVAAELGKVYRTIDGGKSWEKVLDAEFPHYWYGVHAFNKDRILITGVNNSKASAIIRWSEDGGTTWTEDITLQPAPNKAPNWLFKVVFKDDLNGIIVGTSGRIYRTTNGGRKATDWTLIDVKDDLAGGLGTDLIYRPDGIVTLTGVDDCDSSDGGLTWSCRNSIDEVFDGPIAFGDVNYGLTGAGTIFPKEEGWLHRTTDGGRTWSQRLLTQNLPIRTINILNSQIAFAAGGSIWSNTGGIYSTNDGGDSWQLDINTHAEIVGMTIVPVKEKIFDIWCVGTDQTLTGRIYKTRVTLK